MEGGRDSGPGVFGFRLSIFTAFLFRRRGPVPRIAFGLVEAAGGILNPTPTSPNTSGPGILPQRNVHRDDPVVLTTPGRQAKHNFNESS